MRKLEHSRSDSVLTRGLSRDGAHNFNNGSKFIQSGFVICILFMSVCIYLEAGFILQPYVLNDNRLSFNRTIQPLSEAEHIIKPNPMQGPRKDNPILSEHVPRFLPDYKNPCWREPKKCRFLIHRNAEYVKCISDYEAESLLRRSNDTLNGADIINKESPLDEYKLRCIPAFYVIGMSASGTKDLMDRVSQHPDILQRADVLNICQEEPLTLEQYFARFNEESKVIERYTRENHTNNNTAVPYHPVVAGELNLRLLHANCEAGVKQEGNFTLPKYISAQYINRINPTAKIIIVLRNPTERLYIQYMKSPGRRSAAHFHEIAAESIRTYKSCLRDLPLRHCLYKQKERSAPRLPLYPGLYVGFVADWYGIFDDPSQILVIRTEDFVANVTATLQTIYKFLGVRQLADEDLNAIGQVPLGAFWTMSRQYLKNLPPKTRSFVNSFYKQYNEMLAMFLEQEGFTWEE